MKKVRTQQQTRPFINAIIEGGQSKKILRGEIVEVEISGFKYKILWDNDKGLYAEPNE